MKCNYCNSEVASNARFCTVCGGELSMHDKDINGSVIRICSNYEMYCELFGRTKAILWYCVAIPLFLGACLWGGFDNSKPFVMRMLAILLVVGVGFALCHAFTERNYKQGKYTRWSKDNINRRLTYGGIVAIIIVIMVCYFVYMEEHSIRGWMAYAFVGICGLIYYIKYTRKSFQVHEDVDLVSLTDMEKIMGMKIDEKIQATYQNFSSSTCCDLQDDANIMVVSDRKIYYSFINNGNWSLLIKNNNDIVKLGFYDDSYMNKKQYLKLVFSDRTNIMLHLGIYGKLSSNATLFLRKFYEVLDAVVLGAIDNNTSYRNVSASQEACPVENQYIENVETCSSEPSDDEMEKLKELKAMKETGLISEEEYKTCKDAITQKL